MKESSKRILFNRGGLKMMSKWLACSHDEYIFSQYWVKFGGYHVFICGNNDSALKIKYSQIAFKMQVFD